MHEYAVDLAWTGAGPAGTSSYTSYGRDHELTAGDKPPLPGTSDPAFRGDPGRWSPEELLVGSLSQCHMLWFLHLAATAGVVVVGYTDRATGSMRVAAAGHGEFTSVTLRPLVTVRAPAVGTAEHVVALLDGLHRQAHEHCFIARSVNFPVTTQPAPPIIEPADGPVVHPADRSAGT